MILFNKEVAMKKLLLISALVLISTNVMAEWSEIGKTDGYKIYVDLTTIRKVGERVKMWVLVDYSTAQIVGNIRPFLSRKDQSEYDCKEELWRKHAAIIFPENMGKGEVIISNGSVNGEWEAVSPSSGDKLLWNVACNK